MAQGGRSTVPIAPHHGFYRRPGQEYPAAVAGEPTIFLWLHLADIHPRIQIHLPNSHLDIQMGEGQGRSSW